MSKQKHKKKIQTIKKTKISKKETNDELDFEEEDSEEFAIYYESQSITSYRMYFPQVIEHDLSKYHDLLEQFRTTKQEDIIDVYMQCWGGSCDVGMCIAAAMKECKAHIRMRITGNSYSMGAMLALCVDELIMYPSTLLMFHNYTGGEHGKGGEMIDATKHEDRSHKESFISLCVPFLTIEECATIAMDKDVYIHASDKSLKTRCIRHFPRMKEAFVMAKKKKK